MSSGDRSAASDGIGTNGSMEEIYKERYNALRIAFEERIRQLSSVVEATCSKLFADEILQQLKSDPTSAVFIPAHLAEVLSNSLESEKEQRIYALLEKIASLERQLHVSAAENESFRAQREELAMNAAAVQHSTALAESLHRLERNYAEYVEKTEEELAELRQSNDTLILRERQLNNRMEIMKQEIEDKMTLVEHLRNQVKAKDKDIDTLEQSFEETSRELALIEGMEQQEHQYKKELKEMVAVLTAERNALYDENQQLRVKMQYASDELDRCHLLAVQREVDDAANQQRIADLMAQVESMLSQEASDSNAAITAVHEKMKTFRQRMSAELQREKRLSAALQEELQTAKTHGEESLREQHRLSEQASHLREQLDQEQQRCFALQRQLQEESQQVAGLKVKLADAQAAAVRNEHDRRDLERLRALESSLLAERAEVRSGKSKEAEQQEMDKRLEAYKLHYENELTELKKQLKNAYSFDKAGKPADISEVSYKNTIQSWVQENARLKQRHAAELAMVATQLKGEYEDLVRQLQNKLEEAGTNIGKLKEMVRDGKNTIRTQQNRYAALSAEAQALRQRVEGLESSESAKNGRSWNGSTNPTSVRRASVVSASTRASSAGALMSPSQVASEADAHRSAVLQRSLSAPRAGGPSAASANESIASSAVRSEMVGTPPPGRRMLSRRSSTSVLGTSHFIPPEAVVSQQLRSPGASEYRKVDDDVRGRATENAREEAATARRALQQTTEELARVKGQCERLQRDAAEAESTIRDLQSKLASRNPSRSGSIARPAGVAGGDQLWDDSVNASLLEAKAREISVLRAEIAAIKSDRDQQLQCRDAAAADLQATCDQLRTRVAELTAGQEGGRVEQGQRRDDASTMFSDSSSSGTPEAGKSNTLRKSVISVLDTSAYEASMVQMEENMLHHIELSRISAEELTQERQRIREMRQREVKLFRLLAEVERTYRGQVRDLRQDLAEVRSLVASLGAMSQIEVRKTVGALGVHLDRIFRHNEQIKNEEVRQAEIALSNAHMEEMNLLEARFVEQLELQASTHTVEMERLHTELVLRAESALGLGAVGDTLSVDDSLDMGSTAGVENGATSRSQRSVSFASDASTTRSSRQRRHSTLSTPAPARRASTTSGDTSAGKPAYESVATGVLEALEVEEVIDKSGTQQILSLAKAHQEPSFAAQAAAKSIVAGYLEKFVNGLHDRLSAAAIKGVQPGARTASALNDSGGTVPRLGYSGTAADYSLFFD